MSAQEEREQKQFKAVLESLLKLPENKLCADCQSAAPRWASAKLGVFICMKCAGIHRSLGVHISFVRSVQLDKWKPEDVARMQSWGNEKANRVWEAKLTSDYPRPRTGDQHALEKSAVQPVVASAPATTQPPAATPVTTRPAAAATAPVDLLGGLYSSPSAPMQVAPAPITSAKAQEDEFDSFVGATGFGQPQQASAAPAPVNTDAAKKNIMNLFDTPATPAPPAPQTAATAPYGAYPGYPPQAWPGYAPPGAPGAPAPYPYPPPPGYPNYQPYPYPGYAPGYSLPPGYGAPQGHHVPTSSAPKPNW